MNLIDRNLTLGIVRHMLQAISGILVTRGAITAGDVEIVIGIGTSIATLAWSIYDNRKIKAANP